MNNVETDKFILIADAVDSFFNVLPGKPSSKEIECIRKVNEFLRNNVGRVAHLRKVNNGNLDIAIVDPAFISQIKFMEPEIAKIFNNIMGNGFVKSIRTSIDTDIHLELK